MKILQLFLLLVVINYSYAQPRWVWAKSFGSMSDTTNITNGNDIQVAGGYSFVVGEFRGTSTFGGASLTSDSSPDGYLAKLDPNGNTVWVKRITGGSIWVTSVALDNSGNIYITGYFYGEANFIPGSPRGTIVSVGNSGFVAKYNSSGLVQWATPIHGATSAGLVYSNDVTVDAAGNPYVTGIYYNNISNGASSITSLGGSDIFVARLTSWSGEMVWFRTAGGVADDHSSSIESDKSNKIYITGNCNASANFDGQSVTVAPSMYINNNQFFLASYYYNGAIDFVRQSIGIGDDGHTAHGHGVSVDPNDRNYIYVTGNLNGIEQFGGTTLFEGGSFIAKYDRFGALIWIFSQPTGVRSKNIDVTASGVFVIGFYSGSAEFGAGIATLSGTNTLSTPADFNVYVSLYTKNGAFNFVKEATTDGGEGGNAIAAETTNFHIVGTYPINNTGFYDGTSPMNFGPIALPRLQGVGTFIAKYNHFVHPSATAISTTDATFYPNPTNRYISVESDRPCEVVIRSLDGKVLLTHQKKTLEPEIVDLISLKQGWYIIEIKTEKETTTSKLYRE